MIQGRTAQSIPAAARSDELLIQRVGEESVIYDVSTKEAHCLKSLAAFVFDRCDGETRIGAIADAVRSELAADITDEQVIAAVAELEESRLLQASPLVVMLEGDSVSRRDMMRRVGFAGAAATVGSGLVMSIAAPAALASCSQQPAGCNCAKIVPNGKLVHVNTLCASNHCCGSQASEKCNLGCCSPSTDGQQCKCQSNGTCATINPPASNVCCNGACTPSTAGAVC